MTARRDDRLLVAGIALAVSGAALLALAGWGLLAAPGDLAPDATTVAPATPPSTGATENAPVTPTLPSASASPSPDATAGAPGAAATASPAGAAAAPVDATAFTSTQAAAVIDTFLSHVQEGERIQARQIATTAFAAAGGRLFAGGDVLVDYEVLMAIRENGRWVVYTGEEWRSGPAQSRYPLLEAGGKLLVDGVQYADVP